MAQHFHAFEYPSLDDAQQINAQQGKGAVSGSGYGRQLGPGGDPLASLEVARKLKVMEVMTRLLVQEAASLEELNSMIIDLSGEELWQIAEERGLSGKCGSPTCQSRCNYRGKPRLDLEKTGYAMNLVDLECFCSVACKQNTAALAKVLGDPYDRLKSRADLSAAAILLKGQCASHGNHSKKAKDPIQDRVLEKNIREGVRDADTFSLDLEGYPSIQTTIEPENHGKCAPSDMEKFCCSLGLIDCVESMNNTRDLGQFLLSGNNFDAVDGDDKSNVDYIKYHRKGQAPREGRSTEGEAQIITHDGAQHIRDRNSDLSVFGRLYLMLDSIVSRTSIEWIHTSNIEGSNTQNHFKDDPVISALYSSISAEISWCSECIDEGATKDLLKKPVARLSKTFSVINMVPIELTRIEWRVITFALLEAVSWKRSPHLSDILSTSNLLEPLLAQAGLTPGHYQALLSVMAADRMI